LDTYRLLDEPVEEFPAMPRPATVEAERELITNGAARLMDVYQNACLVLQKLKTKGTQRVLVQYQQVNVGEGGQAVVAGRMRARGVRGKRENAS
jgi:hypothetical protein